MTGAVLLAHGSRTGDVLPQLQAMALQLQKALPQTNVEVALLQFSENSLAEALGRLEAQGITQIKILPFLLLDGVHLRTTIPAEVALYTATHPHLHVQIAPPIGCDERLVPILCDRFLEQ